MKSRLILCLLALACSFTGYTQARTPPAKKHKPYFKLLESYTQRTLPGRRGPAPVSQTHFIIVWDGAKYPQNFSWRGADGMLSCNMVKVHKIVNKPRNFPAGMDYTPQNIAASAIHKGDTLELTPVVNAVAPMPQNVPATTTNTLFFKTGNSGWLSFPVKNIAKKQDISMP